MSSELGHVFPLSKCILPLVGLIPLCVYVPQMGGSTWVYLDVGRWGAWCCVLKRGGMGEGR